LRERLDLGAQFHCENQKRRLLILDPPPGGAILNGVEYLEVLDNDAPAPTPRQQTLLVRLFRPVPPGLDATSLHITGGVRERDIRVLWAEPANAVTVPGEPAAFYAALAEPDHVLVVRTDRAGDFSNYEFQIAPLAPLDFDPVLARISFSFKVQCPSSFDCAPKVDCAPEALTEPPIDYLAKDYASFRRVMLDRLSAIIPDWRERNPADLGIALVEALAYSADHLSYFQDAVATEAYLATARRRVSVRRHARLLDYRMHEGVNARALVCLETRDDGAVLRSELGGVRTSFLTGSAETAALSVAAAHELEQRFDAQVFEPLHELALYGAHNRIELYTWGDDQCCLPRGATRATLRDDIADRLRLAAGDLLIFEEELEDPRRRHAVRLTRVNPACEIDPFTLARTPSATPLTDPLTTEAIVEIEWHIEDALPLPFCVSREESSGLTVARGNVVLCDHGKSVAPAEPLLPSEVPPRGHYRPRLRQPEVTHAVPYDDATARKSWSAARSVAQNPREALPSVTLGLPGGSVLWKARPDLLESDRFASEFVVELEETGEAFLRFGDGVLGREPEDHLVARYRVGRGRRGNVGAEAIAHVVQVGLNVDRVRNPLPASGGADPEAVQQVKLYAPQAFRTQERAVTEADYARMAERHPDVQKAVATRRWTGSWYTMFVTVDRKGGRPVDAAFEGEMAALLERFRLAGQDVEIDAPRRVPLDLRLTVCVKPGYFRDQVREALLEALSASDLPGGARGFFHPDNFTFGQPVHLSRVVGAAMRVPGVDWVDPNDPRFLFQRFGELGNRELENGVINLARLEIARLDNSPSLPENGRLELILEGGR
jgi:hypothetical protein